MSLDRVSRISTLIRGKGSRIGAYEVIHEIRFIRNMVQPANEMSGLMSH